jgi:hypothetical protein
MTAEDECRVCGAPTIEVRCKVSCGRCGFMLTCNDLDLRPH